ncbi:hypothetical protein ACFVVL_34305 [Kitasatospora sp. NPDC058115]|uniref:hypothetical protein n=1 Tax=Kitasatospora sp. NPDC058115 TaxID=3346347 RepID=UPI0036DD21EB
MTASEGLDELDYLREIERLAHDLCVEASAEDGIDHAADPQDATPFRRSLNALARAVRSYHFEGDGCTDDRPLLKLAAAAVLKPGAMPAGADEDYGQMCARFGVEPRPEGWALWHTWGGGEQVTMVVSAVATTEGLFRNWSRGRELDPVTPLPSQVALVHRGWSGPMTFAPRGVRRVGVAGRPLS